MKRLIILACALLIANLSIAGDRFLDNVSSSKLVSAVKGAFYGTVAGVTGKHAYDHFIKEVLNSDELKNASFNGKILILAREGILIGVLGYASYQSAIKTIQHASDLIENN